MDQAFSVPLRKMVDHFELEILHEQKDVEKVKIKNSDIYRPGIQLAIEYFDFFDNTRIQILGKVEHSYLGSLTPQLRKEVLDKLFACKLPAVIITRELDVFPELLEAAKKFGVPLYRTPKGTSVFMSTLIAWLNVELAPRITRHGVLVEVYGEGVLILGESGVGKSETAVELVKRGHRLVADDAVEIKKVSSISVVGTAPEIIRHFIEIRGIGIVDVRKIFGMGAVKETEKIDLIIHIEQWNKDKAYDRLGIEDETTDILGIKIPSITVPIRPGRNLAVIVEVAAMNNRQKKMGFNAAEELSERITKQMEYTLSHKDDEEESEN
ncbi:MAG: HPr(Ser) kinase/phosphatase [Bacillota bacterium]|nr:HPr(Ser) kinase/phosphatase [Bacillota bacterium]